ncbi:MAG: DUF2953 domain-containing protein, partial [candidate division Zixibacteria bacterium]|nr:DUF2953 domain-containing protein [candidate division Zixibacteria bacterium]
LVLLAFGYFIFSSIKLRLKFDDTIRFIDLSYTLFRIRLLFNDKTGQIYIVGLKVKSFDLWDILKTDMSPKPKKTREDTIEKKKREFDWSGYLELKKMRYYLKKLFYPIRKINFKYLNIEISDGFSDPYYTGQLYAVYSTVMGIFPKLMSHINFNPDFSADNIKIFGEGLVKLRLCHILLPILQILADKIFGMVRDPFLRLKKGTSYV